MDVALESRTDRLHRRKIAGGAITAERELPSRALFPDFKVKAARARDPRRLDLPERGTPLEGVRAQLFKKAS